MTVGEKIQNYRKQYALSQDALGQKLLVSRQTISLWEKDQTAPTIENLIRLSEIFGVSVDEILGLNSIEHNNNISPKEAYQFNFNIDELNEMHRLQRKSLYIKSLIFIFICIFLVVFFIYTSAPDILIGFALGMLYIGTTSYIKGIYTYNKAWKNSIKRVCKSTYEYRLFENYIELNIYRENEKIRESKCNFTDIEQIQQFDSWLLLQISGQAFIIRKSDLKENSAFYSYMYKNPSKIIEKTVLNKWKTISIILFIASLLSLLVALALVNTISGGLFVENMWLFFFVTPIPVASVIYGLVLKKKGYKYKKNVIAGIIMTVLLCLYGSFAFIF